MMLAHTKHGAKFCASEAEKMADIANGWVVADAMPQKPLIPVIVEPEVQPRVDAPEQMQSQEPKKRGPKPKHKG